jgi:hypothetical protein
MGITVVAAAGSERERRIAADKSAGLEREA